MNNKDKYNMNKKTVKPRKKIETRGRPRAVTQETIQRLETAFSIGASVREAILFADLKETTYYDYVRANPEFSARIELLKERMPLKARQVVYKALENEDVNKWISWISKKDPLFKPIK